MIEYKNFSEAELQTVIDNAEKALKDKQVKKRKQVIAQINELAASIGVTVDINDNSEKLVRKGKKVAAKFRNPDNASQTWTGRGIAPKWMQLFLDAGHEKTEFLI
ncbi:MAG: H-NS histone family protein [Methylococcales bacterium]|nr:H-NS histone family protein [Methylococcales bacterium]